MKNKILFAVGYIIILPALASVAHEIKASVKKEPEQQPEIITVPKTDGFHRNLACRIQRNVKFNKITSDET